MIISEGDLVKLQDWYPSNLLGIGSRHIPGIIIEANEETIPGTYKVLWVDNIVGGPYYGDELELVSKQ